MTRASDCEQLHELVSREVDAVSPFSNQLSSSSLLPYDSEWSIGQSHSLSVTSSTNVPNLLSHMHDEIRKWAGGTEIEPSCFSTSSNISPSMLEVLWV